MMLIPYRLETIYTRIPYANIILIALVSLTFFFVAFGVIDMEDAESMVLRDWDLGQMIGSTFLHADLFHLLGNMIFLWVFGNAVCATVGNGAYPFLYLGLGVCASVAHMIFSGEPALGASGAINGIVGMSLMLFPVNRLHCWYFISLPFFGLLWKSGKFKIRAFWMIIAWAIFDIIGILTGGDNIGHWAHIGGFASGLFVGGALLYFKVIETYDPTFMDVLAGRPLERTNYDLYELAEMPLPATTPVIQGRKGGTQIPRFSLASKQAKPVPAALLSDPLPVLRVTSVVQKGNDLMVFFVNDGDTIKDVSIVTPDGLREMVQPSRQISKREMGSMRLLNMNPQSLGKQNFNISYSNGAVTTNKRLVFDESAQKFVVE